jgi:hypothetical protein
LIIASVAGVVVFALGVVLLEGRGGEPSPGTAAPGTAVPSATSPETTTPGTPRPGDTMTLMVFFHRGAADDPQRVLPVARTVPRSEAVTTAAIGQLLAVPTAAERETGYFSQSGPATAGSLISVRVASGVARADFLDFSSSIPNASSSFG